MNFIMWKQSPERQKQMHYAQWLEENPSEQDQESTVMLAAL